MSKHVFTCIYISMFRKTHYSDFVRCSALTYYLFQLLSARLFYAFLKCEWTRDLNIDRNVIWQRCSIMCSQSIIIWQRCSIMCCQSFIVWQRCSIMCSKSIIVWQRCSIMCNQSIIVWQRCSIMCSESIIVWQRCSLVQ